MALAILLLVACADVSFAAAAAVAAGPPGEPLPDNRAYEMVTPPHKNAGQIGDVFLGLEPQIAEDGSRLFMSSIQCFGNSESCPASEQKVGTPYEFTRSSSGWQASALAPPASQFTTNNAWLENADANTALFEMPTPSTGEYDWYAREATGSFARIGPTDPAPASIESQPLPNFAQVAATADVSHIAYATFSGWPFDATQGISVYEYVGRGNSSPLLVGVSGGHGSTDLISECGTRLGSGGGGDINPMSADGRTVYFTALPCGSGSGANAGVPVPEGGELFARIEESRTVQVSARSPLECTSPACLGSPPGPPHLIGASSDGSKAFFLDPQQLTDTASEDEGETLGGCPRRAGNGCNLYLYDFSNPAGRNLIAVSAGDVSGEGPRVQGVIGISPDGSHVYFIARGVLTTTPNDRGQTPQNGAENMYVYERDPAHPSGTLRFITTVPEADNEIGGGSATWTGEVFYDDLTPDGRFLVFRSRGQLTADDTSTTGAPQVFRYDAQTGQLTRISIGEGGFNHNGNVNLGNAHFPLPRTEVIPQRTNETMSNDGSYVFFESPVALTPGAVNDVRIGEEISSGEPAYAYNVYEWHEGHVYLLSDGRDISGSKAKPCEEHLSSVCLLGTDATARDVFFTTVDPLVPADGDTAMDVYDARVCTPSEPCITAPATPAPCQGEACHGGASEAPPIDGAGTTTFNGPGNLAPAGTTTAPAATPAQIRARKLASALKQCRRKRRGRKRQACESQAHNRYGRASKSRVSSRSHRTSKSTRRGA